MITHRDWFWATVVALVMGIDNIPYRYEFYRPLGFAMLAGFCWLCLWTGIKMRIAQMGEK